MRIYLNDRFVSKEEAKVSVFDRGFLYGDGLFETFRSYSGKIFRLTQHLERLSSAAARLELRLPPLTTLRTLLYETLRENNLQDALIRLTVSRGEGEPGLEPGPCAAPTLVITPRAFSGYPKMNYAKGVSCVIVQTRRASLPTFDGALKTVSFLTHVLAKLEAKRLGAFEGLFLNSDGDLAEGTISNLFWVQGGALKTPSVSSGILEGITRGTVLELAQRLGIRSEEGRYKAEGLFKSEEAFLTGSGLEIMPVVAVDGKPIGSGSPGPVTRRLHHAFNDEVRQT